MKNEVSFRWLLNPFRAARGGLQTAFCKRKAGCILMDLIPDADDDREVATSQDVEADAEFVLDLADAATEEALNS